MIEERQPGVGSLETTNSEALCAFIVRCGLVDRFGGYLACCIEMACFGQHLWNRSRVSFKTKVEASY